MTSSNHSHTCKPFTARRRWLTLLSLLALCCGCLRADVFHYLGYDAADDTFTASVIYTNLQSESPADLEHLAALWKQREEIIIHPFVLNFFGGQQAILRLDGRHYKAIDLAQAAKQLLPELESEIALDSIAVKPGRFFMGPHKTLCYSHQIKVPGKSVDQILGLANKSINAALAEEIPKEIKRRADGGKVGTWDELRRAMVNEIEAERKAEQAKKAPGDGPNPQPPPPPNGEQQDKGLPLSAASLELLQKAAAGGELAIIRHGGEFEVSLPLSPDDCREAKATIAACKEALDRHLPPAVEPLVRVGQISKTIQAENDDGKRLIIKFTVPPLVALSLDAASPPPPDPKLAARYRDVIDFVRNQKISIDDNLTLKQVVEGFAPKTQ